MIALLLIVVVVGVVLAASHFQKNLQQTQVQASQWHLIKGDYPSVCSWCREISLGKKMTVFEKAAGGTWETVDVEAIGTRLPAAEAAARVSAIYKADSPQLRRLCSESCTRHFLQTAVGVDGTQLSQQFVKCSYCDSQYVRGRTTCPNCGAANSGGHGGH